MIRVGFRPVGGQGWQGGRNYLWNLLHALSLVENRKLSPVLLTEPGDAEDLRFSHVERFECTGPMASARAKRVSGLASHAIGRDLVEEYWAKKARLDLLSHSGPMGRSSTPWIFWVPDLQHRHYPDFFTSLDRVMRDRVYRGALKHARVVITSSENAKQDLVGFYGASPARIEVLQFVSSPRVTIEKLPSLDSLVGDLSIPRRYFLLPNQFWKHKNHALVIDALARCQDVVVLATGSKEDYRNPGFYDSLIARAAERGLGDRFRHLGTVSYDQLIALMIHSIAIINPSLFEGWSSTVEEAKSLGKTVLLSDIAVHREQAPARGHFFGTSDADALSALLSAQWKSFDADADAQARRLAADDLPRRMRDFGERYQRIVLRALDAGDGKDRAHG